MKLDLLTVALGEIKRDIEHAITTATFKGNSYENGVRAKEALIRSQALILKIHEVTKRSIDGVLTRSGREHEIHPPIGSRSPELLLAGFIKKKEQDVVVLFDGDRPRREQIAEGPLTGDYDLVGKQVSERSLVVGIRSQLSSVAKNFDTLMERAFAETLNLRLRLPRLVMGEVYMLPLVEYDADAMKSDEIAFKDSVVPVEKFVRVFSGISGRPAEERNELFKYERTALVLADFRESPPKLYLDPEDLLTEINLDDRVAQLYGQLSPRGFAEDICEVHSRRHPAG